MLKVPTVTQQIITEISEAVAEKDEIMAITTQWNKTTGVHRQFKISTFHANTIWLLRWASTACYKDKFTSFIYTVLIT
jgi:hypothetical protein